MHCLESSDSNFPSKQENPSASSSKRSCMLESAELKLECACFLHRPQATSRQRYHECVSGQRGPHQLHLLLEEMSNQEGPSGVRFPAEGRQGRCQAGSPLAHEDLLHAVRQAEHLPADGVHGELDPIRQNPQRKMPTPQKGVQKQ